MSKKLGRPIGTLKGRHPTRLNGRVTAMYQRWQAMRSRCNNPDCRQWKWYGARGITVCERWSGDDGFDNFCDDMGEIPFRGATLGRIDNDAGYSPENCRWETMKQQCANRRQVGPPPDPGSLRQKARAAGLPYHVVYLRIHRLGWSESDALSTPKMSQGQNRSGFGRAGFASPEP